MDLTRESDRQKNRIVDLERALTQAKDQVQIQDSATEAALAAFAVQRAESARDALQIEPPWQKHLKRKG